MSNEENITEKAIERKDEDLIVKTTEDKELIGLAKKFFTKKGVLIPSPICPISSNIRDRVLFLKVAMRDPVLWAELTDEVLSDLLVGAYQDRIGGLSVLAVVIELVSCICPLVKLRSYAENAIPWLIEHSS